MSVINTSYVDITTFFLVGLPGLEHAHIWISIPICSMDLIAVLGNCTILFIIKTEPSLHEPMYYFLSTLAMSDLGLSLSTLPTMLSIFLFNAAEISSNACFAQEFFIHGFSVLASSVLLIMSFDRYLAIHNPLRYTSILTTDVMKLACSDNRIDVIYSFFGALCLMVDCIFIAVSYILIPKTLLGIASKKEHLKALNTCVSHICAVIIFYLPIINLAVVHHFAQHVSPIINVLMANVLLLVPPLMNPIVYCLKTKQIRCFDKTQDFFYLDLNCSIYCKYHLFLIEFVTVINQRDLYIFLFYQHKASVCFIAEPCERIMSIINTSYVDITTFFLVGMPGLEYEHIWISIPICSMDLIAILGNFTILFIHQDRALLA
ncbi:hypothetical protein H8959_002717 [Pygathrix nigripes]